MTRREQTALQAALFIVEQLRNAGFSALLAGGCVRDMLLSREPKDYDVATDATPDQVAARFPRARRVGAKFGVMLVRKFGHDIEVATFRTDGTYSDGRRPDDVTFGTAEQDARRRDFTINGLFYDPIERLVIDYVDGRKDLQAGIVRTIGDPNDRFAEDHLRMLRAIRFAALLIFDIEPATFDAIRQLAPHLRVISPERIWMELNLMLAHPSRDRAWSLLTTSGLCNHLVQDWKPDETHHDTIARRLRHLQSSEPRDLPLTQSVKGLARADLEHDEPHSEPRTSVRADTERDEPHPSPRDPCDTDLPCGTGFQPVESKPPSEPRTSGRTDTARDNSDPSGRLQPARFIDSVAAFAAILLGEPPHRTRAIARALRLSNQQTEDLAWLVKSVPQMRSHPDMELADLKLLMAHDRWPDALALLRADLLTAASPIPAAASPLPTADPPLTPWERLRTRAAAISPEAVAPPPLLTGEDVMALGVPPGPQLGDILRTLYRTQLNEQIATRAEALALAITAIANHRQTS
jgi:hypothetical protein